jgi:hypothetical protein
MTRPGVLGQCRDDVQMFSPHRRFGFDSAPLIHSSFGDQNMKLNKSALNLIAASALITLLN